MDLDQCVEINQKIFFLSNLIEYTEGSRFQNCREWAKRVSDLSSERHLKEQLSKSITGEHLGPALTNLRLPKWVVNHRFD